MIGAAFSQIVSILNLQLVMEPKDISVAPNYYLTRKNSGIRKVKRIITFREINE